MPTQQLRKTLSRPQQFLKLCNNPRRVPPPSRGFQYDVDAALAASMQDGTMPGWVLCELRVVCRKYGLFVWENNVDVLACVVIHIASK